MLLSHAFVLPYLRVRDATCASAMRHIGSILVVWYPSQQLELLPSFRRSVQTTVLDQYVSKHQSRKLFTHHGSVKTCDVGSDEQLSRTPAVRSIDVSRPLGNVNG